MSSIYGLIIVAPVLNLHHNKSVHNQAPPPPSHISCDSNRDIHSACDIEDASQDTVINSNCFNDHDPSSLGNIDPDIHYLSINNKLYKIPYYNDQTFRNEFANNRNLSMIHLNIRSIHDHFLELTSKQ